MKAFVVGSFAVLCSGIGASQALADGPDDASQRNWYVALEGGVEFDGRSGADSGWGGFATVGWQLTPHVGIEAEFGYRTTEPNQWTVEVTQASLMANAVYETSLSGDVALNLGVGVGQDKVTEKYWWGYSLSDVELAAQFKFGASVAVSEDADLVANYRYMTTLNDSGIDNSTLTVGLRFGF